MQQNNKNQEKVLQHIYSDFCSTLNKFIESFSGTQKQTEELSINPLIVKAWLGFAPLLLFDAIFINEYKSKLLNDSLDPLKHVLVNADNKNAGKEMAFISQGVALWYLEFFLYYHDYLKQGLKIGIKDLSSVVNSFRRTNSRLIHWYSYFKKQLEPKKYDHEIAEKNQMEGRGFIYAWHDIVMKKNTGFYFSENLGDIAVAYIGLISKTLIIDMDKLESLIISWDINSVAKSVFVNHVIHFFIDQEKKLLTIINS